MWDTALNVGLFLLFGVAMAALPILLTTTLRRNTLPVPQLRRPRSVFIASGEAILASLALEYAVETFIPHGDRLSLYISVAGIGLMVIGIVGVMRSGSQIATLQRQFPRQR